MNTVDLLDKYQIPILQDEISTGILAYVYYKGSCIEKDLTNVLDTTDKVIKDHLRQLYLANFLYLHDGILWKCSQKSIQLLEAFKFSYKTTEYLLNNFALEEKDKLFILMVLDSDYKDSDYIPSTILLRAFTVFISYHEQLSSDRIFLREMIYALLLGSNKWLKNIGSETFVDSVYEWHKHRNTTIWTTFSEALYNERNMYVHSCKESKSTYFKSNKKLFHKKSKLNRSDYAILTSRILCYSEDSIYDDDIKEYCLTHNVNYLHVWNFILQSFRNNIISEELINYLSTKLEDTSENKYEITLKLLY